MPLQWAATQNNLGNALQNLGEREDGTERLEQAVTAYNAALEVRTREQVPLDWAMTQNNLGAALATLGGAQSCRNPKNRKQNNLGAALATLGAREDGTERLEQAVTAYNAALEVYTREQVPLQWAATQNNLGNALQNLGEREDGTERLEQAVTAYNAALEVRTREQVPLQWANTQHNLGNALVFLGNRESRTGSLELAANAYRAALEVFTPEHMNWTTTQRKLMLVEETIKNLLTNPTTSERGIAALLVRRSPLRWALPTFALRGADHKRECRPGWAV